LKKNKRFSNKEEENSPPEEGSQILLLDPSYGQPVEEPAAKMRTISLYGEVDEERASDVIYSILYLSTVGYPADQEETEEETEEEPPPPEMIYDPIKFLISTYGGSAAEMFAIYDTMRQVRDECEIHTHGLGKVMSAGVLLLAAGSKGKRKIGKNCRVMMHSVAGASYGSLHNLENEMDEIKWLQEQHIKCLIEETNMTRKQIKRMLAKRMNVYLTAEEAVKLGIADEIV